MIKCSILVISCTLLFSCNDSTIKDKEKSNFNKNKIDSTKNDLNQLTSPTAKTNKDQNSFPFDTILKNCLDSHNENGYRKGVTTTGMIDCYSNSAIELDTLVNGIYLKLYSKLDKKDKQKLKLSQDRWRKFYAAEEDFLYSTFYTWANVSKYGHGRDHAISQAEWKYGVVRQRLIDLTKYDNQIFEGFTDTKQL